jgi:hypothetical protein
MKDIQVPHFAPSRIEQTLDVSGTFLRDLRRHGLLEDFGHLNDGRWLYSCEDVVALYIGVRLTTRGMLRQRAYSVGRASALDVIDRIRGIARPRRYSAAINSLLLSAIEQTDFREADCLADLEGLAFDRMEVIDREYLAASVPLKLKALVEEFPQEDDEMEFDD